MAQLLPVGPDQAFILVAAAMVGGYMALNIGANDVANNMGPAVGGHVITLGTAVAIAAICEAAGALLAGGDVVSTVSKGIISPEGRLMAAEFQLLMLAALLSAALWINLATMLNAPVSTTHSIVGGILGAGIAAAGLLVVNWKTMAAIAASWVISPVFGGVIAALMLLVIKNRVMNQPDRLEAARRWLPVLIALMAGALTAWRSRAEAHLETGDGRGRALFPAGHYAGMAGIAPLYRCQICPAQQSQKRHLYPVSLPAVGWCVAIMLCTWSQ